MTHDIFSIIAIHSALLGPQAPPPKFEYVRARSYTNIQQRLKTKISLKGIMFNRTETPKYNLKLLQL